MSTGSFLDSADRMSCARQPHVHLIRCQARKKSREEKSTGQFTECSSNGVICAVLFQAAFGFPLISRPTEVEGVKAAATSLAV